MNPQLPKRVSSLRLRSIQSSLSHTMKTHNALLSALRLFAATLALAAGLMPFSTQAQGLTSEQVIMIKEKLTALQESIATATLEKNTSVSEIFLTASSSEKAARDFYLGTIKALNFDRFDRSGTDFREWARSNDRRMDEDDFVQALRIQLRYLAISTEAANNADLSKIVPPLIDYIDGLASLDEAPNRMLDTSIEASIFAERYDLEQTLKARDEVWELRPTNVGGMYDKTILPYLREQNPTQILVAWDRRVRQEAAMASVRGEDAEVRFSSDRLPGLQWGRLKDLFVYDDRVQAAVDMLAHLEKHIASPLHPNAQAWLADFMALMEMDVKAIAGTEEPASGPTILHIPTDDPAPSPDTGIVPDAAPPETPFP
jgi:hypothetical protein